MPSPRLIFGKPASARQNSSNKNDVTVSEKPVAGDENGRRRNNYHPPSATDNIRQLAKDRRKTLAEILPAPNKIIASSSSSAASPKASKQQQQVAAKLDIDVLSPPLVFHGSAQHSTGALLGGELHLTVQHPSEPLRLQSFDMRLLATVTTKKPVAHGCAGCISQTTELFKWDFLAPPPLPTPPSSSPSSPLSSPAVPATASSSTTPATNEQLPPPPPPLPPAPATRSYASFSPTRRHTFPFSYLLPGHLSATSNGRLGSIEYTLVATAVRAPPSESSPPLSSPSSPAATPTAAASTTPRPASPTETHKKPKKSSSSRPIATPTITTTHRLPLARALAAPSTDRTSQRIFPPTNLRTSLTHAPVLHPIGTFPCTLRLTGITSRRPSDASNRNNGSTNAPALTRWRLKRLTWRLEEASVIVSPACAKHAAKVGGAGRGMRHADARDVASADLKSGWKTDWADGGAVEVEFDVRLGPGGSGSGSRSGANGAAVVCDVETPTGLSVSHKLCLEMIVAEEVATGSSASSWSAADRDEGTWAASGTARVLRMQHAVAVTERGGQGISWDEEMPPMYEDVPRSPPGYALLADADAEEVPPALEEVSGEGAAAVLRA